MNDDRRGGPSLIGLCGGVLLAVSVFLPWYGFTLTASGAATAEQNVNSIAQQFGNSAFQGLASSVGNSFGSVVGRQIGTASAHQALKYLSVVLLVLAGIAILLTVMRLAGAGSPPPRGTMAAIGVAAALCIVFRMVVRPLPDDDLFAVTLGWGVWLALASSAAMVVGDLLPSSVAPVGAAPPPVGNPAPPPPGAGRPITPPRPPGWS